MSCEKIVTRIAATRNRTEPFVGSVSGGVHCGDKVWLWGDDNMLP